MDKAATWERLMGSCGRPHSSKAGLSGFAFFHIASHIVNDPRTGRLSSIALEDREIWLDQLRDLAPLPDLITLSACNGARSLIYEGDEQVGLAVACLIAGASSIVGSLWPVSDVASMRLMADFYENYLAGNSPSRGLALAQRKANKAGGDLGDWASFICLGSI